MEDLDPKILWQGMELSRQNAHNLIAVAKDAAMREIFGAAASLAILGAEEAAKALGLATRALSHRPEPLHLAKYFRNHKHKHDAGAVFLGVLEFYNLVMVEIYALQAECVTPEEEKGSLLVKRLLARAEAELSGEQKSFEAVNEWRKKAEVTKKRGFYVDWTEGSWNSPSEIDAATASAQMTRAETLLRMTDVFASLGYDGAKADYKKVVPEH